MPSIIGSKSCCAVNNRPAPTCAGTLAFALFFIRRLLFPPRERCRGRPILRSAWSRRYLLKFEFQQAIGHRPMGKTDCRAGVGYERGVHVVRVGKDNEKNPAPNVWPQLLVEVVFQFERAVLLRGVGGV